jgi:hypothetical protein
MSYDEAAAAMTTITGRSVRHRAVDTEHYVHFLVESGYDVEFASALAALDDQIRDGKEAQVTDAVARLTGQQPRSLAEYLHEYAWMPT